MSEKVSLTSARGEMLAGRLDRPPSAWAGPPRAGAIFAHCFSCSKDVSAAREIAGALARAGYLVLRFDFAGLGSSEGAFADTNFSTNVEDLVAAAGFLEDQGAPPRLLIGHSLGGAAAIVAATRLPQIAAVATIGAPADAEHVTTHFGDAKDAIIREGAAEVLLAGRVFTIKKQFIDDVAAADVLGAAAMLARPLLILQAPLDNTVGVNNASRLFRAARHPKSFISLDGADHLLSNPADARYAAAVIAAWASRYTGTDDASFAAAPYVGGARASMMPERRYAAAVSIDGRPFVIDADVEDGGEGLGPNPTYTLEAALAACGVITIRMYAERKGWPLESASIDVRRAEGTDPHATRRFEKSIRLGGPLDADQRRRIAEIADKCPVQQIVSGGAEIHSQLLGEGDESAP